jgi:hypothetical protein
VPVRKKPSVPMRPPQEVPNISPNPTAKKTSAPAEASITFFMMMFTAFFAREKPDSSSAKPACMKKTSAAARIVQT